ncbi:hypothetical protein FB451DRAFT_1186182 [Mycena latifolia]|nr:hypothetical protein FB451DRAFT_1186182 [Mycena latifolia]
MGFTVQISNWKQVGGLQLIGTLLEQVKLLPKQIPTCGTPSNGVSISNWGWWRPPMQPVTYREASQAIQLSHQMNLPGWWRPPTQPSWAGKPPKQFNYLIR